MVSPEFEIRPSVLVGDTADVPLQRTLTVLRNEGLNPTVTVEYFPTISGVLCGVKEIKLLLAKILVKFLVLDLIGVAIVDDPEAKTIKLTTKEPDSERDKKLAKEIWG